MILALVAALCAVPLRSPTPGGEGGQAADPAPRISATGTGKVEKLPTALQVIIPLFASGEGTAKAIEALEAKRLNAVAKFKALGADEKDVTAGGPSVVSASNPQERRQNPSMRLRKKKDDAAAEAEKEPVVVSRMLTAQLPLKATTIEGLLVEGEALKAKVKAAGIVEAPKEGDPAGDAETTALAALAENGGNFPDGMSLSFSAAIDEKDRATAAEKAMEEAVKLAQLGAHAAKGKLGAALHVEVGGGDAQSLMEQRWSYYERRGIPVPDLPETHGRVTGASPEDLAVSVMLKVDFALLR